MPATASTPTPSRDVHALEPDVHDADMTAADIVFVLQHLHFNRNDLGTLKLDRQVARYLIDALRRNHGPACSR